MRISDWSSDVCSSDLERIAPRVAAWVRRMVDVAEPRSGQFLADDEIPATLEPVLRRMMREQVPHLQKVADMLGAWANANAGADRKSVVWGKSVSVRVDIVGGRLIKKKKKKKRI